MEEKKYLSVSAINKYIDYRISNDVNLSNIYLKAEISNARISKGILYFVLKDDESEIDAIMFSSDLSKLKFSPKDGTKVIAYGSVKAYPKKGRYSFICSTLEDDGLGQAYLNFLALKEKLAKEGLFNEDHKVPIPKYAQNIGVITSKTGEAINDIIFTINNRFPLASIYLYPAIVQGDSAPASLIKSLEKCINDNLVDFIIIGRGGGSFEDLSCFNDERLARTIYSCPIPIISAVGHEGDFTICDFVSDLRAPTPTGAAMLSTVSKQDILTGLEEVNFRLNKALNLHIDSYANISSNLNKQLLLLSPIHIIDNFVENLENLNKRLHLINLDGLIADKLTFINNQLKLMRISYENMLDANTSNLDKSIEKLVLLNPLNVLAKGYSLTYKGKDLVKSVNDVKSNDEIDIKVNDGIINAIVK